MIDGAIQSVKRISSDLRPGVLDDIGLAAAIEWAAKDFQKRSGIRCAATVDPENMSVDRMRSTALFRIFQESLTNIMRHAQASHVAVSLSEKDDAIVLSVTDNGKGIGVDELASPYAFGLIGMRERVQFLHGTIRIWGLPDSGTTVRVTLPIHSEKEQSAITGHAARERTRAETGGTDQYAGGTEQ
jgi:signal transduction histidine kinase